MEIMQLNNVINTELNKLIIKISDELLTVKAIQELMLDIEQSDCINCNLLNLSQKLTVKIFHKIQKTKKLLMYQRESKYKDLKETIKLSDTILNDLINLKTFSQLFYDRNEENYPTNYISDIKHKYITNIKDFTFEYTCLLEDLYKEYKNKLIK